MSLLSTSYYHPPPKVDTESKPPDYHAEISNSWLTALYVSNIIFSTLALTLAAGQLDITDHCHDTCPERIGSTENFFYAVAIIVILLALVVIGFCVYALVTRAGYRAFPLQEISKQEVQFEKKYARTTTLQDVLPGIDESDLIVQQRPDMMGYQDGTTSELNRFMYQPNPDTEVQ